ncbi:hypothetical protein DPMN_054236 [Dreissena polymorpha]|uniref:Uncharacterized protein n=1 Tax=Dreissena polymorpha TaxID=45954 RepID=A0A9D4CNJ4_DREPO|nr:hypothetical protein DPMN_054236 [Dreissena polymorpha]
MQETSTQKLSQESTPYQLKNEPMQKLQNSEAITPQDLHREQLMEVGPFTDSTKRNPLVEIIDNLDSSDMNQHNTTDIHAEHILTLAGLAETGSGNGNYFNVVHIFSFRCFFFKL